MNKKDKKQEKNTSLLIKNIFLICALSLSALYFVFLMLGLFNVINISGVLGKNFNYLLAFAAIVACLGLYTISLFIENHNALEVPTWLACSFYVCFFVFTNIYYLFGLYDILITNLIFYIALGVLIGVLSLSIYYNCLKNDDGYLQNKLGFTSFMLFSISTTISVCFSLVVMFIKFIVNTNVNLTIHTLSSFGILLLASALLSIIFNISIKTDKKFANACLIKTKAKND
ncbi:MAG: hypothetical protein IJT25_01595 [Clostridia bacterium]|nr:hypothetical protein [Clostridia bacterium]